MGEPVVTGYRSQRFRHQCADSGCYIASLPDWGELIKCFPRGIHPTDVDGFVEINGHLLFLEEKQEGRGFDTDGQRLALRALSRLPRVTVIVFRPIGEDIETLIFAGEYASGWQRRTQPEFLDCLRQWAIRADSTRKAA